MHNAHTCLYVDICETPWCSAEQSGPIAHFPSIALNKSVWQLESQENVRIYSRTLEEKNNNNLQELCQFRCVKISRTKITLSDALASLCHSNSVSNVPCSVEGRVKNIFCTRQACFLQSTFSSDTITFWVASEVFVTEDKDQIIERMLPGLFNHLLKNISPT